MKLYGGVQVSLHTFLALAKIHIHVISPLGQSPQETEYASELVSVLQKSCSCNELNPKFSAI